MLKLPAAECGRTPVDDQFMKSSMVALQTQMNMVAKKQTEDIRRLTEDNEAGIQTVSTKPLSIQLTYLKNVNVYANSYCLFSWRTNT